MATPPPDRICRLCLANEHDPPSPLFSPCKCRGSSKYIHKACLAAWRDVCRENRNYYECPTCKFKYNINRLPLHSILLHPLTLTAMTLLSVAAIILTCAMLLNLVLLAIGIQMTKSAFALSGKLVWWSMMIVGLLTVLVTLFDGDNNRTIDIGFVIRLITDLSNSIFGQGISYSLSGYGFLLFVRKLYGVIKMTCMEYLTKAGADVLDIAEDPQEVHES